MSTDRRPSTARHDRTGPRGQWLDVASVARQLDRGGLATKLRDKLGTQLLTLLIFRIIRSHFCAYNFLLCSFVFYVF